MGLFDIIQDIAPGNIIDSIEKGRSFIDKSITMYKEANISKEDLIGLAGAFINAVGTKVSKDDVKNWKPADAVSFALKAAGSYFSNKDSANEQREALKQLLCSDNIYLEAAYIAEDVYHDCQTMLIGGWKRSTEFQDLNFIDPSCALKSRLYCRSHLWKKEYIYATAGTNPMNVEDWKNNFEQLYGASEQYKKALQIAVELSNRISRKGDSLMFTGHSLGGGEAINNATVTRRKAIVFNPAGLSKETRKSRALTMSGNEIESLVTTFIVTNDLLNWLQDTSQAFDGMKKLVPASEGRRFYLSKPRSLPVRSHLMETVISAMESLTQ